ncbi:TonB-dependent receptor [Flavobacterium amniphilum]|uniref:TonB-dependent siderophore receptor n=1 Tax=Flavobacterium amniphilum TaxID=1834035 RepID=UPI002029E980|nr:TonB-dependent receptor [Flavobacterium amniphilum]MCL9806248.1 TonB-dependent receptor [Flavobacterium amniphilum]
MNKKFLTSSLVLLLGLSLQAQEKNQAKKDSIKGLNEVSVNGSTNKFSTVKTSSSLRLKTEIAKIPQNIQVVTGEALKNQGINNMMENVTRNVSGAQMIEHWGHFARINMRGFKLPAFRNGMNVEMPWGPLSEDLSMVESIEFVKGPSGFMMSAGEPGGFYNVVTKKPTKKSINEISFTGGNFNALRGSLDSGGALTPDGKLQYRINGMYQTAETNREFEKNSRYSIVPSIRYEFSDNTSLTTEFTYQQAKQMIGAAYVFAPASSGFGSLSRNFTNIDQGFPTTDIEELSLLTNFSHKFSDKWSIEAQYMYMRLDQVGASTWVNTLADNGDMTRYVNIWDALNRNELAQIYTNGEFTTGSLTHKIMGGFDTRNLSYYADWGQAALIDNPMTPFNIFNPVYGNAVFPTFDRSKSVKERGAANHQGVNYYSFYAQDEIWALDNKLRVTLASRFSEGNVFAYKQNSKKARFTPRFGVSYDIIPNLTFYGLYDQSFMPQTGLSSNLTPFKPEVATDIEAGLKKSWFKDRLKTTLTAFQITKENIVVGDFSNPSSPISIQLGEVRSKGIEFDMQGQITPELNIILNYANTDVEITKDIVQSRVGTKVAGHSKHMTNGWLNYSFRNTSFLKGLGASIGYQYQVGRSSWDWGANNDSNLPDYFRLDGGLTWKNNHITIAANVNNILNKYLYSGAATIDSSTPPNQIVYWQSEPGINGRLTVSYKF